MMPCFIIIGTSPGGKFVNPFTDSIPAMQIVQVEVEYQYSVSAYNIDPVYTDME